MIRNLFRSSRKAKALKAWQAAQARVADAESRGDDRDLGKAQMELRQAMSERLRAEPVKVIRR